MKNIQINKEKILGSEYYGWAIDTQSKEGHGYIGRYWWFEGNCNIPKHMEGHRTALFCTRREAREALPKTRRAFPKSKVIKVIVRIQEELDG